jgi:phosphoenolpyruvate-protein phosphotransferase
MLHRIVLDAASAHTVEEQVERLVAQVRAALDVAVCSLYQRQDDGRLLLVASHGLNPEIVQQISLDEGEGLVGLIASERLPINQPIAHEHPSFRHFPESGEDTYPSFLGVPVLNLGRVAGVIVVQDRLGRRFTDDEQSFLVTVAAQLGPVLLRLYGSAVRPAGGERLIQGSSASTGKAIGTVHLVMSDATLRLVDVPASRGVDDELAALERAVAGAREELEAARRQMSTSVSAEVLEVFDFYKLMLSGDRLISLSQERIRAGASAFAAVRETVDELVHAFDAVDDDYLRARGEDVRHVGNRLLSGIMGADLAPVPGSDRVVLLGAMISISDIGAFEPGRLAAIVCFKGSSLSHTAVLARSLGIPAVMGTGPIDHLNEGTELVVDGDTGQVILEPSPATLEQYRALIEEAGKFQKDLLAQKDLPAVTTDGERVTLLANTGLLADAAPGRERGAEGIGLYRSEIPFLAAASLPTESEQVEIYRQILSLYHPLPVTMRTLDVGGDKQLPYLAFPEENPSLGWRGIRFALDNRAIFATQLRAMLRASEGLGNLQILLPMITNVSEVRATQAMLTSILGELTGEGRAIDRPRLGIMVEVPGVVALLPRVARHIDFASVGTNDLAQYLLAVDRGNPRVAAHYDQLHPSVLHTLADIQRLNRRLGLELTVCGELAADPLGVVVLLGLGFRRFSANAFSIPRNRALVRLLSAEETRRLARRALRKEDPAQVRDLAAAWLVDQGLQAFLGGARAPLAGAVTLAAPDAE